MKYTVVIETDKDLDTSMFEVYRDIKKRLRLTKKDIPKSLSELDCDCISSTKYYVK